VVVLFGGTEGGTGGETFASPSTTGSGISFGTFQQQHQSTGSDCGGECFAAVASANSSGTFSIAPTHSSGNRHKVIGVYIVRGSGGIGNSNMAVGSGRTVSLTPTAADGTLCWLVMDWATAAVQSFTPTTTSHGSGAPGPTASPASAQVNPNYTYYFGELDDQTSAGAVSYGIGGSGTGPFTIIAFEVKAAAGGATVVPAQPLVVPSLAAIQAGSW
jgi:hypothetical protein